MNLAEQSLPRGAQPHDVPPPLRISQRMKLEPSQLEGVDKRIQVGGVFIASFGDWIVLRFKRFTFGTFGKAWNFL